MKNRTPMFAGLAVFTLAFMVPAHAKMKISNPQLDGKVFSLSYSDSGITWEKCKDYTILDDGSPCNGTEAITLPENFYKAFFYYWISKGGLKKSEDITDEELSLARAALKNKKSISTVDETLAKLQAQQDEIARKVDYLRFYNSESSEGESLKAEYANRTKQIKAVNKIGKLYEKLLTQIKDVSWISKVEGNETIGLSYLKSLSKYFVDNAFTSEVLKFSAAKTKTEQAQEQEPATIATKPSTTTSTAPKTVAPIKPAVKPPVKPVVVVPNVAEYLSKIQELIPVKAATLAVHANGALCLLDPSSEKPLQCLNASGLPIPLPAELNDIKAEEIRLLSGFDSGAFLVQKDNKFIPISVNGSDYSSQAQQFNSRAEKFKLRFFDSGSHYYGPQALDPNGNVYTSLTNLRTYATPDTGVAQIDADAEEFVTTYYSYNDVGSSIASCWISNGRVKCLLKNVAEAYSRPLPTSGEGPKALQLEGVNRLAIATNTNNVYSIAGICTSNGKQTSCVLSDGNQIDAEMDTSRGLYTAIQRNSSSPATDFIVCGFDSSSLRCLKGTAKAEFVIPGISADDEILAATSNLYGICAATKKGVYCSDNGQGTPFSRQLQ